MSKSTTPIHIIGGGLAGSEAAWQVANSGISVKLVEMRPTKSTPAHHTGEFGELVEVGNSKALSEAILYAFKNQSDMLLKVKKSENYMKKFYTENVVNEYKKLLTNEHR